MSIFSKTVHPEKLAADYLEQDNQHEPQLDKNLWADRVKRDKEAAANAVSVRTRGKGDQGSISLEDFVSKAKKLVEDKSVEV